MKPDEQPIGKKIAVDPAVGQFLKTCNGLFSSVGPIGRHSDTLCVLQKRGDFISAVVFCHVNKSPAKLILNVRQRTLLEKKPNDVDVSLLCCLV